MAELKTIHVLKQIQVFNFFYKRIFIYKLNLIEIVM